MANEDKNNLSEENEQPADAEPQSEGLSADELAERPYDEGDAWNKSKNSLFGTLGLIALAVAGYTFSKTNPMRRMRSAADAFSKRVPRPKERRNAFFLLRMIMMMLSGVLPSIGRLSCSTRTLDSRSPPSPSQMRPVAWKDSLCLAGPGSGTRFH
jgi:hypothetical protein